MDVVQSRKLEEREETAVTTSHPTTPEPATGTPDTQDGKTASGIPQLRRIGAPDLRGSRPESPVTASWCPIAATQDLIAVTPSAVIGVARSGAHPGSCAVGRARAGVPHRSPCGHSLTPPPLIGRGHGEQRGVRHRASASQEAVFSRFTQQRVLHTPCHKQHFETLWAACHPSPLRVPSGKDTRHATSSRGVASPAPLATILAAVRADASDAREMQHAAVIDALGRGLRSAPGPDSFLGDATGGGAGGDAGCRGATAGPLAGDRGLWNRRDGRDQRHRQYYEVYGEGQGDPVILLHGGLGNRGLLCQPDSAARRTARSRRHGQPGPRSHLVR